MVRKFYLPTQALFLCPCPTHLPARNDPVWLPAACARNSRPELHSSLPHGAGRPPASRRAHSQKDSSIPGGAESDRPEQATNPTALALESESRVETGPWLF